MKALMELVGAEMLATWIDRWGTVLVALGVSAWMGWMFVSMAAPVWAQLMNGLKVM